MSIKVPPVLAPIRALGRPFSLLFIAGVLSDIGGFTTQTALVLHVYKLSAHNPIYMGLIALATLLPMVLMAPVGGVLAEKWDRRMVMVANDLVRIPLVLLMMVTDNLWLLLLLQCLVCAATALFMPSRQSIIPEIVPPSQLQLANSLNGGVLSVVHVLGPVLGANLYALTGTLTGVVAVEAATYAMSALLLLNLLDPRQEPTGPAPGLIEDIRAGFRYVRGEPALRQIFMILVAAGMAVGLMIPLLRPFVEEVLHAGDETYARMIAAFGFGGLLGPLLGYLAGRRFGLGRTLTVCFVLEPVLLTLWSLVDQPMLSLLLVFVWGIDVFAMIPCYTSYLHLHARKEYMGRTFALFDQSMFVPQILAAVLVMALGNKLPTQNILGAAGVCYLLIVLGTLNTQGGRRLRQRRPADKDVEADANAEASE